MPVDYSENKALLQEVVTIQEVDGLLEWLLANPDASIDLSQCEHLHTAALQTLLSAGRRIESWPDDPQLKGWLAPLFEQEAI